MKDHENSAQHKSALSMSLSNTTENLADKINSEAEIAIHDALKVLYFIISKNLPLDLFSDMTDLCISVGSQTLSNLHLAKNANYTSWDIVHELLGLLSSNVRSEVTGAM